MIHTFEEGLWPTSVIHLFSHSFIHLLTCSFKYMSGPILELGVQVGIRPVPILKESLFSSVLPRTHPVPFPHTHIVASSSLEAGVLPQSCLETSQLPKTLNPHHPIQASESRPKLGTWIQETWVHYRFFFRYIKVTLWAMVGQGSICNMPKRYSDKNRGSIATKLGSQSLFQHLQAVYSQLALLIEMTWHPLKLAQEIMGSFRATWCRNCEGGGRGSVWPQRVLHWPGCSVQVILSVPHPFILYPSTAFKSLCAFHCPINFSLSGTYHGVLSLPS